MLANSSTNQVPPNSTMSWSPVDLTSKQQWDQSCQYRFKIDPQPPTENGLGTMDCWYEAIVARSSCRLYFQQLRGGTVFIIHCQKRAEAALTDTSGLHKKKPTFRVQTIQRRF